MNWEAIGAIAEFLSSIGVLATLIYIAVQVRDAKNMNQITSSADMTSNVAGRLIENPHLVNVIAKVNDQTGFYPSQVKAAMNEWGLSGEEAELWGRYWGTVWRGFQSRFTAGAADDTTLAVFLENPQSVLFLRSTKRSYTVEFVEKLESLKPGLFE